MNRTCVTVADALRGWRQTRGVSLYEWRRRLRTAVAKRDPNGIVEEVSTLMPGECLQAVGSALLIPLTAGVDAAGSLAARCVELLRDRDWDGDAELVAELEAALGHGVTSTLRPVPVDLESLADVLSEGLGAEPGLLDLDTGEVWPAVALDYARENDDPNAPPEPDGIHSVEVAPEGSDESYRDMRDFIQRVEEPRLADRLARAIEGRGAFRRFRDALDDTPDEMTRWQAFSDDRQIGRARTWLADAGLRPVQRSVGGD
jgi:hypothetical protein